MLDDDNSCNKNLKLGNSMRRGTPSDCCLTDSNASTIGTSVSQIPPQQQLHQQQPLLPHQQLQKQHAHTPITQMSYGEDDSSCDSHTRWGKSSSGE